MTVRGQGGADSSNEVLWGPKLRICTRLHVEIWCSLHLIASSCSPPLSPPLDVNVHYTSLSIFHLFDIVIHTQAWKRRRRTKRWRGESAGEEAAGAERRAAAALSGTTLTH